MQKQIPSKYTAATLGIFLGALGVHQIYLKNNSTGAVWLIVAIIFSWTFVVPIALAIVGFLQGLSYLFWDDKDWAKRFES